MNRYSKKCILINNGCADRCYSEAVFNRVKGMSGKCHYKYQYHLNNIKRKHEEKKRLDRCRLSILANDYNSLELRKNPRHFDVYTLNKEFSKQKTIINGVECLLNNCRYNKSINHSKIRELHSNINKKPYENSSDTSKKNYYNSMYDMVYASIRGRLPKGLTYDSLAKRKTIDWIKRYAASQGVTNDGWPATVLIGSD